MWSDECFVEFQGCFRFAKMELTIHKAYEFACLATYIGYVVWVDQDMSVVIWVPRHLTEFTRDSSVSGLMKSHGGGIECKR